MTDAEADAAQKWASMDGATAFLLIERHANNWQETGAMMEAWRRAAEAETARRCAEAIQKYLDHHAAACAHYTPKDHPAFSYHLTRVAIADDIKQAIKAEFLEAFK